MPGMIAVGLFGADPVRADLVDVSRGGLKARTAAVIPGAGAGSACFVRFLEAAEQLRPHSTAGVVRRVESTPRHHEVAVEFERPLEVLDADTLALGIPLRTRTAPAPR